MDDIELRVINIIADVMDQDVDAITLATHFRNDLDADSLDLVELIMAFEKEFKSEISDSDSGTIQTVGDAVLYIRQHL